MKADEDSAPIRFPPPFIYLGMLLIGLAAERLVPLRSFGLDRPILVAIGAALALAGLAMGLVAMGLFRRSGENPEPWTTTHQVVTTGLYRYTRNPMYLGMALLYFGLALALDAPLALMLEPVVLLLVQTQVIAREERYLAAKFGEAYDAYRRQVRRWL
jgi:protein-S-isoprenylcysteine O-methyltransferase Ste14